MNSLVRSTSSNNTAANYQFDGPRAKALVAWASYTLRARGLEIKDFPQDLTDGVLFINLYEILTGKSVGRYEKNPKISVQKVGNIQLACDKFKQDGVKLLTNPEEIQQGNSKVILGVLYTVVYRYVVFEKNELVNSLIDIVSVSPYNIEEVTNNLAKSSANGLLLCALIHSRKPDAIPYSSLDPENGPKNIQLALDVAENDLKIPALFSIDDFAQNTIDDTCIAIWLSLILKDVPIEKKEEPIPPPVVVFDDGPLRAEIELLKNQLDQLKERHQYEMKNKQEEYEKENKKKQKHFEELLQEKDEKMEKELQLLEQKLTEQQNIKKKLEEEIEQMKIDRDKNVDPDELRRQELERILREKQEKYEQSLAKMKQIEEEKRQLELELKEAQDRYARDLERFEELEKSKRELAEQIEDLKSKLSGEIEESDQMKSRLILLTEQQQKAAREGEEILSRRATADKKGKELNAQLRQMEKEKEEAEKKARKAQEAMEKAKAEQEEVARKLKKKLEDENRAKLEKKEAMKQLKKERDALKSQLSKSDSEIRKHLDEIKRMRSRRDTYKKKYHKLLAYYKGESSNSPQTPLKSPRSASSNHLSPSSSSSSTNSPKTIVVADQKARSISSNSLGNDSPIDTASDASAEVVSVDTNSTKSNGSGSKKKKNNGKDHSSSDSPKDGKQGKKKFGLF